MFSKDNGVPSLFGGPLILDYAACFKKLKNYFAQRDARRIGYFSCFRSTACESCKKTVTDKSRVETCSECDRKICFPCGTKVHLASFGETQPRLLCGVCFSRIRSIVDEKKGEKNQENEFL